MWGMDPLLQLQGENFIHKIKHYLITTLGVTSDEASDQEFYRAFCQAFREEIMINWTASKHTFQNTRCRRVYYISMEYMPGRQLTNNIANICASDITHYVLQKMGRDMGRLMRMESDIGIGNGGLGRLASCFMDSLATQQYPALGYGMRYQYGIFEQEVWCGVQVERPDCWLLYENPWEFRRDNHAVPIKFDGRTTAKKNKAGEEVFDIADHEEVRALPFDLPIIGYRESPDFSVLTLRIWSTKESPRNFELQRFNAGQLGPAGENTSLTDVLYPNDNHELGKRMRLKQEFLLSSASLQDIIAIHLQTFGNMDNFADKTRVQINDTHPALCVAELMRLLMHQHNFSWKAAFEATSEVLSYTNHTVLKEALEEWNVDRVRTLLPRQFQIIEKLNQEFVTKVRAHFPDDEERVRRMSFIEGGQIRMANLSIYGSHHVNGVAELHTEILKADMFKDFYEMMPEKFLAVTNGVTQRRWLLLCNPELSAFITKRIGNGWIQNFQEIEKLKPFADEEESQKEFLEIKKKRKELFLTHLVQEMETRHWSGLESNHLLGTESLFDVQIKRFHEYKRQLMNVLHTLILYQELAENPNSRTVPRMVFIGGKAAPGYETVKHVLRFIYCLARKINQNEIVRKKLRLIFVENYNVSNAEMIIPASDLSQQISTAGMEASGTGNMKLSINGSLTIGTDDGANVEMRASVTDEWWPFQFGACAAENAKVLEESSYNPQEIIMKNPRIQKALDCLLDGSLTENDAEAESLRHLHHLLVQTDRYFVLKDLVPYYETQKRVEELFANPIKWAQYALHNIAAMGPFSSDVSIRNYAEKIWQVEPAPTDPEELRRVREEYSEHDKCRILPNN